MSDLDKRRSGPLNGLRRAVGAAAIAFLAVVLALTAAGGARTDAGRTHSASLALITEPNQGYGPIDTLLSSPKHRLDVTMYELDDSAAEGLLAADARRGVDVRVLLDRDYIGSSNQPAFAYLRDHGVHIRWASTRVAITHEKSFVIDGRVAVIMTGNLTSRYYATDRDFAVVDRDAADVAAIEKTFGLDWADRAGTPPAGLDLVWSPGSEQPLISLIESARGNLLVENEEMSADPIVSALEHAARRGVTVDLVMTRSSEWDTNLDALERAGVHVRTYSEDAPLYIHTKVIDVDGSRVFIGSENFSTESLQYNRELGIVTASPKITRLVTATLARDFAQAQAWTT